MKTKILILLSVVFSLAMKSGRSQSIDLFLAHDRFVSPTEYLIDVYVQANSANNFLFNSAQLWISFNPVMFPPGATVTASYVAGSSEMNNYVTDIVSWDSTQFFFMAKNIANWCTVTTLVTSALAKRIATFRLNIHNGQVFNCVSANPSFGMQSGALFPHVMAVDCPSIGGIDLASVTTCTDYYMQTLYGGLVNLPRSSISTQPLATGSCPAGTATFHVSPYANDSVCSTSYQWLENNIPVSDGTTSDGTYSGATDSVLTISNASSSLDGHLFSCIVSGCCTDTSLSASLEINNNPSANLVGVNTFLLSDSTRVLDAGSGFSSYLWSTNETTQTITVHAEGFYWVEVTTAGGCTMHDSIEVSGFIGIDEIGDASEIIVYPNPAKNILHVADKNELIKTINIFNSLNQKQKIKFTKSDSGGNIEIDIASLSSGLYFIEAITPRNRFIKKFIKN